VSDTIRVYIKPQIAVAITPNNSSVCAGGSTSVTLTATASGGDAPYKFIWNTGPTGQALTVNTGGSYSVSVTDTNNCLPAVQSVTVATTPLPTPPGLSSNSPVCEGGDLKLFATAVPGGTYSWTGPNGFTSSQQNPVINNVTIANAGLYSVTVTVGQCTSNSTGTPVIVNPIPVAPAVSNNSPLCQGTNLNLTASAMGGVTYNWTGPNGFVSSVQNPVINNVGVSNSGTYNVTVTANGCTSAPSSTVAVVNALPSAPIVSSNSPLCTGNSISLFASAITNASYAWTGPNGFTSALQNPTITNAGLTNSGTYSVTATVNGCAGAAGTTSVTVNSIPAPPIISSNGPVCEGTTLSLSASAVAGAIYSWSGPNGFISSLQNPSILNSVVSSSGTYSASVAVNGCASASGNLAVIVNPIPVAPTVGSNSPLCAGSSILLTASSVPGASYLWSGPNGFSSTAQDPGIANSNSAQSGTYSVKATVNGCTSQVASESVVVNLIPSAPVVSGNSPVCSGSSIVLNASTIPGANYNWSGPSGFTSSQQNVVIPNAAAINAGTYAVSVTLNGCTSTTPASIPVAVNQTPSAPLITNNSPLCEGSLLNLSASDIAGANYSWTGPNGFVSSLQNNAIPSIDRANAGAYNVTATVNGCTSPSASTSVVVDQKPVADAGNNQVVCASATSIPLSGAINGGSGTGMWSTNGTGTFSPGSLSLNAKYSPSSTDKSSSNLVVTLISTNNGSCPASSSSIAIGFVAPPTANAGNDQTVCANNANIVLNGQFNNSTSATWSSSGTGAFTPSNTDPNATYIPGPSDKTNGTVKLTLTTTNNGPCPASSDAMILTIKAPPTVNGGVKYVLEQSSTILSGGVVGLNLRYVWSPAIYLNSDTIANPTCTPIKDVAYQLQVEDALGCTSTGDIMVKVLKHPEVPNVFTPNGDGINDRWQIKNLADYPDCTVDIYDRYGQLVFHSAGYTTPWDGTSKSKPLPAATYYYIINPKNSLKPIAGFVDVVK
jgi:gliding motility-associated-like protein